MLLVRAPRAGLRGRRSRSSRSTPGPGMADVARPVRDGYSTAGTLGIGLGAIARHRRRVRRALHAGPGHRARHAASWPRTRRPPTPASAACTRPMGDENVCGDAFARQGHRRRRHGDAVRRARPRPRRGGGLQRGRRASFHAHAMERAPPSIVERVHRALGAHPRRRASPWSASIRPPAWSGTPGVGNISAWIVPRGGPPGHGLAAGHRRAQGQEHPRVRLPARPRTPSWSCTPTALTERWDLAAYPGLLTHIAHVIAGTLLPRRRRPPRRRLRARRTGRSRDRPRPGPHRRQRDDQDVFAVRQLGREVAAAVGFEDQDQIRVGHRAQRGRPGARRRSRRRPGHSSGSTTATACCRGDRPTSARRRHRRRRGACCSPAA